ncbi:hypothetical protein [Natronorarus salvus]
MIPTLAGHAIPLAQHETYPIELVAGLVLLLSVAITLAWVAYLYR